MTVSGIFLVTIVISVGNLMVTRKDRMPGGRWQGGA